VSGTLKTKAREDNASSESSRHGVLLALFIGGILIFFVGMMFLAVAVSFLSHGNSTSFGVVVFLGPFPIVIGAGPEPTLLLLVAVIVAILFVSVFLLTRLRRKRTSG
jgi:uncharacterized membrane protein